jgi:hypothetical protein
MQLIENETVVGKTITIDEKHLINCMYKNCVVIYSGGDYALTNTTFDNCQITLSGAAQRTANLLGNFGVIPPTGIAPVHPGGQFGFPKKTGPVQ